MTKCFIFFVTHGKGVKMENDNKQKTTIRIDKDIWYEVGLVSDGTRSRLIERLLLNYLSVKGSKQELELKIKECDEIISEQKIKKKEYQQMIKEIEKQEEENKENTKLIKLCEERIDRQYKSQGFIEFKLLRTLNNTHKVPLDVLNQIVLDKEYKFK